MFAHYTQHMHELFRIATDKALKAKRAIVEPDFLFLAMLEVRDSIAALLVTTLGVDIQALKGSTEQELNESNEDRRDLSAVKEVVENAMWKRME